MYAPASEQSSQEAFAEHLENWSKRVTSRREGWQVLQQSQTSHETALQLCFASNPVQRPTRRTSETDAAFDERIDRYVAICMREMNLRVYLGSKMTPHRRYTTMPSAYRQVPKDHTLRISLSFSRQLVKLQWQKNALQMKKWTNLPLYKPTPTWHRKNQHVNLRLKIKSTRAFT